MKQKHKEKLREEWKKHIESTLPEPIEEGEKILAMSVDSKDAFDWWLAKLDQMIAKVKEAGYQVSKIY